VEAEVSFVMPPAVLVVSFSLVGRPRQPAGRLRAATENLVCCRSTYFGPPVCYFDKSSVYNPRPPFEESCDFVRREIMVER
jgi:hypothetical protein